MNKIIPFVSDANDQLKALWLDYLENEMSEYKIVLFENLSLNQIQNAKVAIVANPKPTDIALMSNLVWVQSLWAGVEKLMQEIPDASFEIVRMVDPKMAETMAQSVLAWTLYLHKNMPAYKQQQMQKIWKQHIEILAEEKNIAVLGLGNLGISSALKLQENGFNVLGWSRSKKDIQDMTTYYGDEGLNQILTEADIVICLLPLTQATNNLLNKQKLDLLRPNTALINFARANIINYKYLFEKIEKSELAHAVLDVFESEPLGADSVLWDNPNITILPHISGPTNMKSASKIALKNIKEYYQNGLTPIFVDKKKGY